MMCLHQSNRHFKHYTKINDVSIVMEHGGSLSITITTEHFTHIFSLYFLCFVMVVCVYIVAYTTPHHVHSLSQCMYSPNQASMTNVSMIVLINNPNHMLRFIFRLINILNTI
eukprot:110293_1